MAALLELALVAKNLEMISPNLGVANCTELID